MKKFILTMIFWNDGHKDSTRVKNVEFTWPKMKEITQYLKDNGINCDCELYDFSSEKVISDSVHIDARNHTSNRISSNLYTSR